MGCQKIIKQVEKIVLVDEEVFQLELNREQMQALVDVLYLVGGSSLTTRRKYIEQIGKMIDYCDGNVYLPSWRAKREDRDEYITGGLIFKQ